MLEGGQLMVVLIVLIAVVGGIIKNRHRHEHRVKHQGVDGAEASQLRDEVRRLKDRVQVLERVITDNHGGLELDREIERLRDR